MLRHVPRAEMMARHDGGVAGGDSAVEKETEEEEIVCALSKECVLVRPSAAVTHDYMVIADNALMCVESRYHRHSGRVGATTRDDYTCKRCTRDD